MTDIIDRNLSFEAALQELEQLVKQLEEGRIPLDDAISAYEKGHALRMLCEEKLNKARMRVEQITFEGEQAIGIKPFADTKE